MTNKPVKMMPNENKLSRWSTYWDFYRRFVSSPRVHFVYDALFYVIFLMLFSYMVLCELSYYETKLVVDTVFNKSSAYNNTEKRMVEKTVLKAPSFIEYLLIFWIFSFMMEEARQVRKLF